MDTSRADKEEQAEKSRKRAARKAAAVRRMVRAKDRVSSPKRFQCPVFSASCYVHNCLRAPQRPSLGDGRRATAYNDECLICPGVVAQRRPETNMDEKEIALRRIATKGGESHQDAHRPCRSFLLETERDAPWLLP